MSGICAGLGVADVSRRLAASLARAGIESATLDARLLVEAATGLTREAIVLAPERALLVEEADRLREMVARRLAREPVTRILGERSFFGRSFIVTPATLDPRPETETLVELALEIAARLPRRQTLRILDIGTGTGCVLLTLLAELEGATGVGIDISMPALAVARLNADRLGLLARAAWCHADGKAGGNGAFDLVVSNPPYVASADIDALELEVRDFDPRLALDGGTDGLDVVRAIVAASARRAHGPHAWYALEIGAGQAGTVVSLVAEACGPDPIVECRMDLGGHTRCVAWLPRSKAPHENLLASRAEGVT